MMKDGLPARLVALNALTSVFDNGKTLDDALEKFAKKYNLSAQDRSFAHALCGFVLRYRDDLQKTIDRAKTKNGAIKPSMLNTLLLMGAAQLLLMDVPAHAAIDTSVNLTNTIKCARQSKFVNAVLRAIQRTNATDLNPSLPGWLVQTWEREYGIDTAQDIEQASLTQAQVGISNKDGTWCIGDVSDLSPNEWVQDFASYMPVSLLPDDLNGKTVLDLCAAPGGKTMQLAAKGAKVTAIDISQKRLNRLTENLERTALSDQVDIVCADVMKWQPDTAVDMIILDAPCSATGTIRRHPDLPFIRSQKDIDDLTALQTQMLDHASAWIKDGGTLVYCTCSLQKSEGEDQIETFLKNNENFKRSSQGDEKYHTTNGDIRLLPSYGDMDGFFISILEKV